MGAGARERGAGGRARASRPLSPRRSEVHRNAVRPADLPGPHADDEGITADADEARRRMVRYHRQGILAEQVFGGDAEEPTGALFHVGARLDDLLQCEPWERLEPLRFAVVRLPYQLHCGTTPPNPPTSAAAHHAGPRSTLRVFQNQRNRGPSEAG